ncbi:MULTISPECIES: long-chain fatty acid--CoA ligase [unclassified Crossiella]|uniref:acyl-CoA synthetase n=1 Tax=unclassified Crossiella TaxID=2620835 RepID=UPI001FFF561E|nr:MULTISPECIES: long-chain fatty acid--CoA ligase [unclassified Crossiella]MCK2243742.1 long-chain fatty acid--CoA ligase [Crossiella sp. S99.2]MCK2257601.1 long-chain fatty acid--CoA ligase [Crossiella sp. S99.1]
MEERQKGWSDVYLTQSLHRAVQQTPDAVMTVYGDRRRTTTEVAERVARLAGALRGLGVGDGDRVAMLSLNSDRYHEYLLAVPWANAVVNPVNVRWSPAEIVYSLRDSQTTVLLVDDTFAAMLPALQQAYPELTTVIHTGEGPTPAGLLAYEDLIAEAAPIADARRGGAELAGVFYTGGTTGSPKGVMLSHTNLLTSALGAIASGHIFAAGARYLHAAPMFHLADLAGWAAASAVGGTHVIIPNFSPIGVMHAIQRYQVTDTLLVPVMIQMVIDHPELADYDLSSLRAVAYGASPIPQAVLERAMKAFPNASLTQLYGMTELSPIATVLSPAEHQQTHLLRSAGRAAPHSEIRIVDPDDNDVPCGEVGEIVVRGAHVMLGYWNKPAETAAAVRDGWMHTGDGGYLDKEGYLFVVDRIKDMIVTGGENVYSAEVENALAHHPTVAACAVIGVPDEEWGERVHAVIVLKPGEQATAEEIRTHVKTVIAGYKAPRSIEFVTELPVSGAGKILKRELRKTYWGTQDRHVH